MLLDHRNHPRHDLPPPERPPRTYVVAATPRTGSTLLCRLLWATGQLGAPKEYLNPTQRRDWQLRRGNNLFRMIRGPGRAILRLAPWPDRALRTHLDDVRQHRSSGGWFGLKIHHHHHRQLFRQRALDDFLGPLHWIHIHRADRVGQAISWARALQTGQWAAGEGAWLPPVYAPRLIQRCLDEIEAGEAYWEAFFARSGTEPLRLECASLVSDPSLSVGAVCALLGAAPAASITLEDAALLRQADGVSELWRARFSRWRRSAGAVRGRTRGRSRRA